MIFDLSQIAFEQSNNVKPGWIEEEEQKLRQAMKTQSAPSSVLENRKEFLEQFKEN